MDICVVFGFLYTFQERFSEFRNLEVASGYNCFNIISEVHFNSLSLELRDCIVQGSQEKFIKECCNFDLLITDLIFCLEDSNALKT